MSEADCAFVSLNTPPSTAPSTPEVNRDRISSAEFAKFMSKSPDFWVFRRFECLNLFNLLCLQRKLVDLERRVDHAIAGEWLRPNGQEIEDLLPELQKTLKEYNDALFAQTRQKDFASPQPYALQALRAGCWDANLDIEHELQLRRDAKAPKQGCEEAGSENGNETESKSNAWPSDHVALASSEKGWIHKFVDRHPCLGKIFEDKESKGSSSSFFTYSESQVRWAERTVISAGFCLLLLCPIAILYFVTNKVLKLGIVLIFVLVASALTSDFSNLANKTNVAVVAGYSAILVVFIANGSGS